jgi:AraC family transcriptional regulator of arabinose operon
VIQLVNNPNNPAIPQSYTQYTHPPGILISDYYNQPYGYTCYRSSGTKDWLIMYTLSGRGILRNGEDTYECTEGDFTIVPPGTPHNYFTAPDSIWEKLWAHFIPRATWLDWIHLPKSPFPVIHKKMEDSYLKTGVQNAFKRLLSYNLDIRVANRD